MNSPSKPQGISARITTAALANIATRAYERALAGESARWSVDESKLPHVARMVARALVRKSSSFRLPPYGALFRLDPDGFDRLSALSGRFDALSWGPLARTRSLMDLVVTASLLDVDPGAAWRMRTRTGALLSGDRGALVVAYNLVVNGGLARSQRDPLRVDAEAMSSVREEALAVAFAASEGAAPEGLSECVQRLRAVGESLATNSNDDDGTLQRPGASLIERLAFSPDRSPVARVDRAKVLPECARVLAPAYEDRTALGEGGRPMTRADLRYLELALAVPSVLSGWMELPVGGESLELSAPDRWSTSLLIDAGVLIPRATTLDTRCAADDPAYEELLALSTMALDAVVVQVRALTKTDATRLSHGSILAWGTAHVGRALAAQKRPGGAPAVEPDARTSPVNSLAK